MTAAPVPGPTPERAAELAAALDRLRTRIDAAARDAGRAPDEVALLAVTKTRPAADVAALADLGLSAFGENKEQEGAAKAAELAGLRPGARPEWHVVGRLQRKKARSLARWAHAVDSVDSPRLADALGAAAATAHHEGERADPLRVLLQVSLDGDPDRGGVTVDDLPYLADRVATHDHLSLDGVMAVAPRHAGPAGAFALLAGVAEHIRAAHPQATTISAGMSGDLEAAIMHGSTVVRVGTALLGGR